MKAPKKIPAKPTTKKEVEDNDEFDDEDTIPSTAKKPVEDDDDDFDLPLDDLDNFDNFDDDEDDY